ncbi:hypothetical protein PGT21_034161, partial [Puccinia graminis f. sp. tritici]
TLLDMAPSTRLQVLATCFRVLVGSAQYLPTPALLRGAGDRPNHQPKVPLVPRTSANPPIKPRSPVHSSIQPRPTTPSSLIDPRLFTSKSSFS